MVPAVQNIPIRLIVVTILLLLLPSRVFPYRKAFRLASFKILTSGANLGDASRILASKLFVHSSHNDDLQVDPNLGGNPIEVSLTNRMIRKFACESGLERANFNISKSNKLYHHWYMNYLNDFDLTSSVFPMDIDLNQDIFNKLCYSLSLKLPITLDLFRQSEVTPNISVSVKFVVEPASIARTLIHSMRKSSEGIRE